MKRTILFMTFFLLLTGFSLIPLDAQVNGDVNNDGSIDIIDALLIAQYYVGLDPGGFYPQAADIDCDSEINIIDALMAAQFYVGILTSLPECPVGQQRTLTIEVTGREAGIVRIDMPNIDPPGAAITGTAQFVYENGTSVNLYMISSTPPPPPPDGEPPVTYQTAVFEGYASNNIYVDMDGDKTVRVVYTTNTLYPPGGTPYPTGTPPVAGDSYLYQASGGIYVIDPEVSGMLTTSGSIREDTTIPGFTGEGYIECYGLPSYIGFGLQAVSTTDYYEVRLRTWNPGTQQWTFDGFTEPVRMKFSYYKASIRLHFSSANYLVDRIVIFPGGTPESDWQNLSRTQSLIFTGSDNMILSEFIIR